MTIEQAKNIIIDCMSEDDIIAAYNEYFESMNDMDSIIYDMSEFNEIMSSLPPIEIAREVLNGNFDPADDYFTLDGYGNAESLLGCQVFSFFVENVDDDYIIELAEQYE
nr:MAG TPA: hypothetical protein [Caudoviricetes sp.]